MNVFNRILAILLLIAVFALLILVAITPFEAIRVAQSGLTAIDNLLRSFEDALAIPFVAARIALVVVALLIFAVLLWFELRRNRPRSVKVSTESGSRATVTADSVARRLSWHIDQLADVISVSPQVIARGKRVDIVIDLETSPEIDVPMKTDEVIAVAREVIVHRMGMQLGKAEVHITHTPYRDEAYQ